MEYSPMPQNRLFDGRFRVRNWRIPLRGLIRLSSIRANTKRILSAFFGEKHRRGGQGVVDGEDGEGYDRQRLV